VIGSNHQQGDSGQSITFTLTNSTGSYFNLFHFHIADLENLAEYIEYNYHTIVSNE